jgi:hypothetical protein
MTAAEGIYSAVLRDGGDAAPERFHEIDNILMATV